MLIASSDLQTDLFQKRLGQFKQPRAARLHAYNPLPGLRRRDGDVRSPLPPCSTPGFLTVNSPEI